MKRTNFHRASANSACVIVFCGLIFALLAPEFSFAQSDPAEEETAFYRSKHYIPIKGEQDSDYPKGVYLVTDDVVIKKGRTMTFLPGTLVLFKKDTRITVEGRLICQGTPKGAITFGRLANEKYLIPLDSGVDARWDGIFVAESGSVEIRFADITGSKYGLENDQANGTIILDTVMFQDNKFQNLKVGGNSICVPEDKFVFYSSRNGGGLNGNKNGNGLSVGDAKRPFNWKLSMRIGSGAIALAGGALYVAESIVAADNQKKLDAVHTTNTNNNQLTRDEAANYEKKVKDAANIGNAAGIIGILGAVGFAVTFFF